MASRPSSIRVSSRPSPRTLFIAVLVLGLFGVLIDARYNQNLRWRVGAPILRLERWIPEPVLHPLKQFLRISVSRQTTAEELKRLLDDPRDANKADLRALLNAGLLDPNVQRDGEPLFIAVIGHNDDGTAINFIEQGADLRSVDKEGRGALYRAIEYCRVRVISELLTRGVSPTEPVAPGVAPRDWAQSAGCVWWNDLIGDSSPELKAEFPARDPGAVLPNGTRLIVAADRLRSDKRHSSNERVTLLQLDEAGRSVSSPTYRGFLMLYPVAGAKGRFAAFELSSVPWRLMMLDTDGTVVVDGPRFPPLSVLGFSGGADVSRVAIRVPAVVNRLSTSTLSVLGPDEPLDLRSPGPVGGVAWTKSAQIVVYHDGQSEPGLRFAAAVRLAGETETTTVVRHALGVGTAPSTDTWAVVSRDDGASLKLTILDGKTQRSQTVLPISGNFFRQPVLCMTPDGAFVVVLMPYAAASELLLVDTVTATPRVFAFLPGLPAMSCAVVERG